MLFTKNAAGIIVPKPKPEPPAPPASGGRIRLGGDDWANEWTLTAIDDAAWEDLMALLKADETVRSGLYQPAIRSLSVLFAGCDRTAAEAKIEALKEALGDRMAVGRWEYT